MTTNRQIMVICGSTDMSFDNIDGYSVGTVKTSLQDPFSIPKTAAAFVNGNRVADEHRLRFGDVVEFIQIDGRKGLGGLLSSQDLMKAWRIDQDQYQAWIADGLPTERLVDGSTAHFAMAVDEWCRARVKVRLSKNPPPMRSKWLRLKDAASLVGVSTRQLARYADQGKIAHKRKPGRGRGGRGEYLFLPEDIERFNARTTLPAKLDRSSPSPKRPALKTKTHIDPKICGRTLGQ